jgi:hypothetical protein
MAFMPQYPVGMSRVHAHLFRSTKSVFPGVFGPVWKNGSYIVETVEIDRRDSAFTLQWRVRPAKTYGNKRNDC